MPGNPHPTPLEGAVSLNIRGSSVERHPASVQLLGTRLVQTGPSGNYCLTGRLGEGGGLRSTDRRMHTPDLHQVVGLVTGVQEEPDLLNKVVNAGLSSGAPDVHHPFVCGLVVLFSFVWGDVPEGGDWGGGGQVNRQSLSQPRQRFSFYEKQKSILMWGQGVVAVCHWGMISGVERQADRCFPVLGRGIFFSQSEMRSLLYKYPKAMQKEGSNKPGASTFGFNDNNSRHCKKKT